MKSENVSSLVLIFSTTYQNGTEIEPGEKSLFRAAYHCNTKAVSFSLFTERCC